MGVFEQFPYTNLHELNIDWILSKMKELEAMAEQHVIDTVARAGVAQNAQDIADLQTEVTNNATTAHNEAQAAQNTANTAYNTANTANNTANTANNTANAANTAITTLSGYFHRMQFLVETNGAYNMATDIDIHQAGILFAVPRGYSVNNSATIMFIYKPNSTTYYHTYISYPNTSSYRLELSSTGDLTHTNSADVTYDAMLYLIRTS